MYRRLALLIAPLAALAVPSAASALTLRPIGSYESPMHVASDPGNPDRLFVVERAGRVQLTTPSGTTQFLDISERVNEGGERGLFSIAFPVDFATTGLFYVVYTSGPETDDLVLDEYRSSGNSADPSTRREVLSFPHTSAGNHNGGQLQFGPDGYLYWSTGEGANPSLAQNDGSLLGKILRIDPRGSGDGDYSIPPGNPFAGSTPGADEIWSLGLRNPWRFSFDRLTGAIAIADVGASDWEEVDWVPQDLGGAGGTNFGWPCKEGFEDETGCTGDFTAPIFVYANDAATCAITGGYVVRDSNLGDLYGRYLYTDLCAGVLRSIVPAVPFASGDRSEGVEVESPVSFGEDACGRLYVVSILGTVYRLEGTPAGLCPAGATTAKSQTRLELKAKRRRVPEGDKAKLRLIATLCPGRAGDRVELRSRGKTVARKRLNDRCRARFRKRIERRTKFRARIDEDEQHLAARSNRIRVRVRR